jgi:DNA-binding NtrC family response regulator
MEILVVEDSPEVSLITVEYLAELGHQAVAVADAEAALTELDRRPFDVVMTDVSLPGMSGIDLAKALVRRHPSLPVVISSGYGALDVTSLMGQSEPHVLLLPKPYDMALLDKTLARALAAVHSRA